MAIQQTFDFMACGGETGRSGTRQSSEIAAPAPQHNQCRSLGSHTLANPATGDRTVLLNQLRRRIGCIQTAESENGTETFSSGAASIDGLLPQGGLPTASIIEWVASIDGCSASALSLITAAAALEHFHKTCIYAHQSVDRPRRPPSGDGSDDNVENAFKSSRHAGPLVVVAPPNQFYPPAAVSLGIPAEQIIWVRPKKKADTVWAIDQALRSPAVAAVWAPIDGQLDDRDARRFQLSAETGNTVGLLVREATASGRPTFAEVRFGVEPVAFVSEKGSDPNSRNGPSGASHYWGLTPFSTTDSLRALRVTLNRCRGGQIGSSVMVQINDRAEIERHETVPLPLADQLARPQRRTSASTKRRRRA